MFASRDSENRDPSSVRAPNALCDFFYRELMRFPLNIFHGYSQTGRYNHVSKVETGFMGMFYAKPSHTKNMYCSVLHSAVEEMCAKNEFRFSSITVFRGHNAKKFKARKVQMVQCNERLGIHHTRRWISRRFRPSGTQIPFSFKVSECRHNYFIFHFKECSANGWIPFIGRK